MKPIGVRDGESQGEVSFAGQPLFTDEVADPTFYDVGEVVRVDHPTAPDAFVMVRITPYRVKLGRARFIRQQMTVETDSRGRRQPGKHVNTEIDGVGLFAYEIQHAVTGFAYRKRNGELVQVDNRNERTLVQQASELPAWFGSWLQETVQKLNAWDDDGQEAEGDFRPAA